MGSEKGMALMSERDIVSVAFTVFCILMCAMTMNVMTRLAEYDVLIGAYAAESVVNEREGYSTRRRGPYGMNQSQCDSNGRVFKEIIRARHGGQFTEPERWAMNAITYCDFVGIPSQDRESIRLFIKSASSKLMRTLAESRLDASEYDALVERERKAKDKEGGYLNYIDDATERLSNTDFYLFITAITIVIGNAIIWVVCGVRARRSATN